MAQELKKCIDTIFVEVSKGRHLGEFFLGETLARRKCKTVLALESTVRQKLKKISGLAKMYKFLAMAKKRSF